MSSDYLTQLSELKKEIFKAKLQGKSVKKFKLKISQLKNHATSTK